MGKQKSLSSVKVVESTEWDRVAELGKKIIKALKVDSRNDPLRVWMAHYIAELLKKEKVARSERQRNSIRKESSDLIIRLWSIRDRFDRNDPINLLNENIKTLLGQDPFREFVGNKSDTEKPHKTAVKSKSEGLGSIIKLSEKERKAIIIGLASDDSHESVENILPAANGDADDSLEININELLGLLRSYAKEDPMLQSILDSKTKSEKMAQTLQVLSQINEERVNILKHLAG